MSLEFPFAHFATDGTTADVLYPIVWEVVCRIEYCGLNVITFTCEGVSPNHRRTKLILQKSQSTRQEICMPVIKISSFSVMCPFNKNCQKLLHSNSRTLWVSTIVMMQHRQR